MLKFLIEAFKASKGRMPNNMEMILLKQKAAKQSVDERKVVSMFDRSAVNPNKPIMGGKNIPETEDEIRRRLMKQNEEGIASMKSKLEDPEKKAMGGRIGYSIGDRVMPSNDFMNLGLGNITQGQNTQTAGLLDMFKDTPEEKALEQIQELRDKENQIKGLGEGAIELKQDELKGIEQQIQDLKNQYPDDEDIQQALDPYANIQGQTAGLGVASFLVDKLGPKIGGAIFNYGKNKILNKGKNVFIDKPVQKILTTSGGSKKIKTGGGGGKSLYDSGSNYRSVDSSGNKVTSRSAAGTTTFDSKSGRGRRDYADGGRIGYKVGTGKKGVESLIDLIRNKFGKKSITTADKAPIPPKTLERDMFKKADENFKNKRMLDDDEYQDFLDEVGGADQLEAYDFDGTVGDAKRIIKEQKQYMDDMELEYKKGNLDPEPGDKSPARKRFLEKKLEEMEASGDKKLMTVDEIEELSSFDLGSEMDVAKTLAPKMVERLELKKKYPGITDDLLDKILIDDNMQRKAEVLATIDEAFRMLEKGKSADEILDTMKNVTRTKQADGGITRVGYKAGSVDKMRRLFLKAIGAGTAGVGAAKSGIFSFGKGAGKEVAKEVVKETPGTYPPPYFFKLAEKIKFMGDDVTKKAATKDREIVTKYKDYEMSEDVATGEIVIKKRNEGSFYDQDGIISDEYIVYKPGQADELTKGKKPPPEYEEFTVRPDVEGKLRDTEDGLDSIDEILEEVGDPDSMTIKKASGGIARMLGE